MSRLEPSDWLLAGAVLAAKAGTLILGMVAWSAVSGGHVNDPMDPFRIWNHWDAPHYLDLVVFGYRAVDDGTLVGPHGYRSVYPGDLPLYIVFYPLFPWLSWVVNLLLDNPLLSAFVVSGIASLFVAPLLFRLVRHEAEEPVAWRAAGWLLIFPTAYFLHIGYTEALFLALVIGSFLAARTERWWLAGLLGGLAALTRVNGLILIPALAVEAATQWFARPPEERRIRLEWVAIAGVGLGYAVYLGLNQLIYGDAFTYLRILDDHWFKRLAPPWEGLEGIIGYFDEVEFESALMYGWMEMLFIGLGLVGTAVVAVRFRASWLVWMAGNWLLFVSTSFVLSVPRYALTLFPLYAVLGLLTRRWWVLLPLAALSIAGYGFFVTKFVNGGWAF